MTHRHYRLKLIQTIINIIVKAREIQKARIDGNVMTEELTKKDLERFHKPVIDKLMENYTPSLDPTQRHVPFKSISHQSNESLSNERDVQQLSTQNEAQRMKVEDSSEADIDESTPIGSTLETPRVSSKTHLSSPKTPRFSTKTPRSSRKTPRTSRKTPRSSFKTPITLSKKDIIRANSGIDESIMKEDGFNMPSEILADKSLYQSNNIRVNRKLMTLERKLILGSKTESYEELNKKINAFENYQKKIKSIKAQHVKDGALEASPNQTGSGIPTYRYYSSFDELIMRLNLLCSSREAGNNSQEVINEIVSILDILLNKKLINLKQHKFLTFKWSY